MTLYAVLALVALTALPAPPADAGGTPVFVTAYNPEQSQTDDDACTGASGRNLCTAAREGDRVIALSRDLLWFNGGPFRWHDKVKVTSKIPQCNGVYSVEDTMNKRFTLRADLFFLDRKQNTSCQATIVKHVFR